ncbi:Crp/Fnr family transcriptional regulator [Clostridium grantii]|uniref:cAMP-binding domain of CRP or a regulatory subunit of cAMP-dependent protein kinases n=1 Tax=Clostridium grantii DSM 8605 TaxID=1121316 RepID=A0A1M5QLK9_9CLOT|nr:Crp/Fnr family transcriptional regulator [Clostridium grantii]SHH14888.1 cAMP-binding domain of CRP or a regulatory subunit of cAMP-dependent protein kinases [Clostridium grantii DSM 8605]
MDKIHTTDLCFLENANEKTVEAIKSHSNLIKIKKGEKLFSERDELNKIYFVLKGKMTMFKSSSAGQKKVVYILDEGQIINEVLFDAKFASINCEAFENSNLLGIDKDKLLELMEKDFLLTQIILNMMSKKIRRLYRQLKNTVPKRMDKKVAAKLWKLSRDYGVKTENGTMIDLNITITYLADMLGSPRETISRAINLLKNEGMISFNNKKIVVDPEKLAEFYRSRD